MTSPGSAAPRPPPSWNRCAPISPPRRPPSCFSTSAMAATSRLAQNILLFARTLRAAGLPIGPGKVIDAIEAVKAARIGTRGDFYWTLHAGFLQRREQRDIFDQAFHIFWKNPQFLQRMMSLLMPQFRYDRPEEEREEIATRLAEALQGDHSGGIDQMPVDEEQIELDAAMTFSGREMLQERDFEKMTSAELAESKKAIATLRLPIMELPTRRFGPDSRGRRVDMR